MTTTTNQTSAILAHLKAGNSLTSIQAFKTFGCTRLAARILEIKRAGHPVTREMITTKGGKHVARYRIGRKHSQ